MIRHLLKLVWNRKRSNALVIAEIFFSFLVMFGVATMALYLWTNSRRPLGFDWRPVWMVRLDMKGQAGESADEAQGSTLAELVREVGTLPQVEAVTTGLTSPYGNSTWLNTRDVGARPVRSNINHVSPGFDKVFRLDLSAGRWFQPGDGKLAWRPIVIDRDLARDAFGEDAPLGKAFGKPEKGEPEERVIGVLRDFRKEGELGARQNSLFYYSGEETGWQPRPNFFLVRVRPGTTAAFERGLLRRMQAVAPTWTFTPVPLADLRRTYFRKTLAPTILGSTVAFFLLVMVGLGLIGVLWQGVLRRTRELGLRRAAGAARADVLRQIVFEQLLLTTLGVIAGVAVAAQLPLIQAFSFLDAGVVAGGLLGAVAILYLVSFVCALYPSLLAGRLQPADALRYE